MPANRGVANASNARRERTTAAAGNDLHQSSNRCNQIPGYRFHFLYRQISTASIGIAAADAKSSLLFCRGAHSADGGF
jgi:hypothetical protein